MTVFIGVDDTDSPGGMCTTYLLTEIIRELDFPVLYGYPRLVRLNPNIPWKTRGNGALSLAISGSRDSATKIGEIEGREVLSSDVPGKEPAAGQVLGAVSSVVERLAEFGEENTNPGVVVTEQRPSSSFYWRAVRDIVTRSEAESELSSVSGLSRGWKNGRGLIGATAAVSWSPVDRTYEVISYREANSWGSARQVNLEDILMLDTRYPTTFSNYDRVNRHPCIVPSSPCPVLFGIRGDDPSVLESAMKSVRGERKDRWLIFESNQATDDHITVPAAAPEPYHSYRLGGIVSSEPFSIRGGHTFFNITTEYGDITCAAFEETKELRKTVGALIPGDRIVAWGSLKPGPECQDFNLEKIAVLELSEMWIKPGNPSCPSCGRKTQSSGKGGGYRCRVCHIRGVEPQFVKTERAVAPGVYGVASGSRRHLSMPPERMRDEWKSPPVGGLC